MYQFHQEQHSYALRLAHEQKLKAGRSWVMKSEDEQGFVKLPHERILHKSPPRTSLDINSKNPYPGTQPFTTRSEAGVVYITNQRIVYLPTAATPELTSFSAPILNLQDSFVRAPFFGANYWTAACRPVPDGGIPPQHSVVELKFTFKEGGAFDFHTIFEQVKERLGQAQTVARENGMRGTVDVDLEQLPAYEPAREVEEDEGPTIVSPVPVRPQRNGSTAGLPPLSADPPAPPAVGPDELPPGYDEAQAQPVGAADLDQRLRDVQRQ